MNSDLPSRSSAEPWHRTGRGAGNIGRPDGYSASAKIESARCLSAAVRSRNTVVYEWLLRRGDRNARRATRCGSHVRCKAPILCEIQVHNVVVGVDRITPFKVELGGGA